MPQAVKLRSQRRLSRREALAGGCCVLCSTLLATPGRPSQSTLTHIFGEGAPGAFLFQPRVVLRH
jgi:hypothetical protein